MSEAEPFIIPIALLLVAAYVFSFEVRSDHDDVPRKCGALYWCSVATMVIAGFMTILVVFQHS